MKKTILFTMLVFTLSYCGQIEKNTDPDEQRLLQSLQDNPNDFKSNFEIASFYYNKAVEIIQQQPSDSAGMLPVEKINVESILLFRKSLKYAKRAYQLAPGDSNSKEMLSGIYFALGDATISNQQY